MPHPVPDHPYQMVGVDLLDCNGKSHIVVTDYFSNYPEVATLQVTSSQAVIAFLKTVFARHGVPCEVFSDNGPRFCSREFNAFTEEWGFKHTTSSPNNPRSNGLVESSVKIVKALIKKSHDGKTDFQKSLMIYRSAPLQNGLSPAQMLMGRRIRTNLPIHQALLTPAGANKIKAAKQQHKIKQREKYDKKAKTLQRLKPGDRVRILNHASGTREQQGCVERELLPRSYEIQTERGAILRRNRGDLRPQVTVQEAELQPNDKDESDIFTSEQVDNNSVNHTDSDLSKEVTAFPGKNCRPKRTVRPHERLIENC